MFPVVVFGLLLMVVPSVGEAARRQSLPGPIPAEIVAVIDGDTIEVEAQVWLGQRVRTLVRLLGVDAPEIHGRCAYERETAEKARLFSADALRTGPAMLRDVRHDKYGGRVLARIQTGNGADLGRALLDAGLARPYRGARRGTWCAG